MKRLLKNDDVIVISGKDKGKQGAVSKVFGNGKVLVDGINLVKKHVKPNSAAGEPGGIIEKEMPIDASNVSLFNAETQKSDKVTFKVDGKEKVRVFRSTGKAVRV